jgi:exo-1,4-beta-D-glucosaminidase
MYEAANHRMWHITSGFSEWKLNACWPTVQWHIYDWYLKPMVSYYYIKKACEPLHVQLTPLDGEVIVVNNHLDPKGHLELAARVYDFGGKMRWEKSEKVDIPANSCRMFFTLPALADLTPVYFVKLQLKDAGGALLSDNFYWLPLSKNSNDLARLKDLPPARLSASYQIERQGAQCLARVRVENPTGRLAFFVHLVLTKGPFGEEVVPVLWEDNYFSLLPGDSRQLAAAFAAEDLGTAPVALEMGGWNVESQFACARLWASKTRVKANEPFRVTALVANTFIDGSKIALEVDDRVVDSRLVWARASAGASREVSFPLRLSTPGAHRIKVGSMVTSVSVE